MNNAQSRRGFLAVLSAGAAATVAPMALTATTCSPSRNRAQRPSVDRGDPVAGRRLAAAIRRIHVRSF
jgi:hypothetical protein